MLSRNGYVENLRRLYVAHDFYETASEGDRGRIFDACELLFDRVTSLYGTHLGVEGSISPIGDSSHDSGLDRSFGVLLLMFGNWFLEEQFGCNNLDEFVAKNIL